MKQTDVRTPGCQCRKHDEGQSIRKWRENNWLLDKCSPAMLQNWPCVHVRKEASNTNTEH